jgi:hypothetical protein
MGNKSCIKKGLDDDNDVSKEKRFSLSHSNSHGWLSIIFLEIEKNVSFLGNQVKDENFEIIEDGKIYSDVTHVHY